MISSEMPGEEAGLYLGEETNRDFFIEEGMVNGILFSILPSGKNNFSGVIFKEGGSVFLNYEIIGGKLLAVDDRQRQTVDEVRTKFFH